MRQLNSSIYEIYALSLPRGLGFGRRPPISFWSSEDGLGCGVIRRDEADGSFGILAMRRRMDNVWKVIADRHAFTTSEEAFADLQRCLCNGDRELIPPGVRRHLALYDLAGREPSGLFKMLAERSHWAALGC